MVANHHSPMESTGILCNFYYKMLLRADNTRSISK